MRYIINERQYKLLTEEEQKILHIPSLDVFGGWKTLQQFLERKGNPLYSISGNLDLEGMKKIESLGNLTSVGGYLNLYGTKIESLGNLTSVGGYLYLRATNIKSLGNLNSVGGSLYLNGCENLTSLGNLTSVGGDLNLEYTPISKKYSKEQIRQMVEVGGDIFSI